MPISATGHRNSALSRSPGITRGFTPGFTLVELMVVLTVIALAAGAVVWSLPDPAGRVGEEAARFALRVRAAHDSAIVEARPVSVWITAGGYGFDARAGGTWLPLGDRPFQVQRWKAGTRATTGDAGSDPGGRTRVVFDPTGLADRPLDLGLQRRAAKATVRIGADGSVAVDG